MAENSPDGMFILYGDDGKYESLPQEKQIELVLEYQKTKDVALKNKLVETNIKFVINCARPYSGKGVALGDLVILGCMGMDRAVEMYKENENTNFISYTVWWVEAYIRQGLNNSLSIRVPPNAFVRISKFKRMKEKGLSNSEIAKELDVTEKVVRNIEMDALLLKMVSMDFSYEDGDKKETENIRMILSSRWTRI